MPGGQSDPVRLLLLGRPGDRCPQRLRPQREPARFFDHGLVYWLRWAIDLDHVLGRWISQMKEEKGEEKERGA